MMQLIIIILEIKRHFSFMTHESVCMERIVYDLDVGICKVYLYKEDGKNILQGAAKGTTIQHSEIRDFLLF